MTDHATLAERLGPVIPLSEWLASPDVATGRRLVANLPDGDELVDALGLNGREMRNSTTGQAEDERARKRRKRAERGAA